jgi:hypothetical protein
LTRAIPIVPLGFERRAYVVSDRLTMFASSPLGRDFWNSWAFRTSIISGSK